MRPWRMGGGGALHPCPPPSIIAVQRAPSRGPMRPTLLPSAWSCADRPVPQYERHSDSEAPRPHPPTPAAADVDAVHASATAVPSDGQPRCVQHSLARDASCRAERPSPAMVMTSMALWGVGVWLHEKPVRPADYRGLQGTDPC